jgi:hypothetical protein
VSDLAACGDIRSTEKTIEIDQFCLICMGDARFHTPISILLDSHHTFLGTAIFFFPKDIFVPYNSASEILQASTLNMSQ